MSKGVVYLIPSPLADEAINTIPSSAIAAIKECSVFFVENERTARRYFKQVWKEMVIDDYEWFAIHKAEEDVSSAFRQKLKEGKTIGIVSEAGCPGIADPGQLLVAIAQEMDAEIKPLAGPSSIILALMASGMNGQQFRFAGYLPIDSGERTKKLKELEAQSQKDNCTQIFIETPYRNNQLIEAVIKACKPTTRLCIAANISSDKEWIKTMPLSKWAAKKPDIHKQPAIFLIHAER